MKIAVLSSHTLSLFWFRMDMMREFIKQGHTVFAIGPEPEKDWVEKFAANKIHYRHIFVDRNGINPISDFKTYKDIFSFLKQEEPDKIFAYQAKTIIYGYIAAKNVKISEFYPLIAGLGSIFRGDGLKNRIIRNILKIQYKVVLKTTKSVFFQNNDDKNEFIKKGIIKEDQSVIINGSGVNLDIFDPQPVPIVPTFLFIGRLIKDKGIIEYLEACRIIKTKYTGVRCLLVGPYDSNPSAINHADLQHYIEDGVIEYYGEQGDVRPYIKECSVFILPSYHEGTPKTVLEAMAVGRPIITTDAPGCRETVVDGYNGFLVPIKDVDSLVKKMGILIKDVALRNYMAENSLKIAREKYDVNLVNKVIMETMGLI